MLEYVKTILKKVSFDRYLFEKELFKAIKALVKDEISCSEKEQIYVKGLNRPIRVYGVDSANR